MGLTLAYDAAQERQYQDRLEAGQRLAEREAALYEELRSFVAIGMVMPQAGVRPVYVRRGQTPGRDMAVEQSMAEAVHETLEYDDVLAVLMTVLEHSQCPHVVALRKAIAEKYARTWAGALADLEAR